MGSGQIGGGTHATDGKEKVSGWVRRNYIGESARNDGALAAMDAGGNGRDANCLSALFRWGGFFRGARMSCSPGSLPMRAEYTSDNDIAPFPCTPSLLLVALLLPTCTFAYMYVVLYALVHRFTLPL